MNKNAQTIIEYAILIGLVTVALYYMGPGIKRGVQSLIKVTADQVGNQQNADQDFNDTQQGYMVSSKTNVNSFSNTQTTDRLYVTNVINNQWSDTVTNTITNGGFDPDS